MNPIHIISPGRPLVWDRPKACIRNGRIVMFDPKIKEREAWAKTIAHHFPRPFEGAIKMEIFYFFAIKDKKLWGEWKTTRGDLDNLGKSALDSLSCIAYNDDSQIVSLHIEKKYAETDSTHIIISQI